MVVVPGSLASRLGVGLLLAAASGAWAQAAPPASTASQWLLNPAAERSHVLSTGELLGAGRFRVGLHTHLFLLPGDGRLQLREHLVGAFAPLDRLQLLAQLPVVLLQRPAVAPEQGVGRPWAGLRVGLLSPAWDDALWLAVEAAAGLPGLEQADLPTRTPTPSGLLKVSAGLPASRGVVGLEATVRAGVDLLEVGGGLTFAVQGLHLGGELTVRGEASALSPTRGFVELLAGVRYRLRPVELSLLAGPGLAFAGATPNLRAVAGLAFVNPEEEEAEVTAGRRPDCTEGTPYRLADCPDLDWDHDGLLNGVDRCPTEWGPKENQGCPWPDSDADTVIDPVDNCPRVPGPPSNAGCPPERPQKVVLRPERLEILEKVFFEFDKAVIRPESFELLQQVAEVLRAHPELRHVRIEGHTDRVGGAAYNRQLSLARARAVKDFLVDRGGVDGARLSTRGFGFDQPLAPNDDEAGRAKNRRVEFLILKQAEADAPAESAPESEGVTEP